MNKVPASKVTMSTHYEIVELRHQEDAAARQLAEIQTKRKDLEEALRASLEGSTPRKYTRRAVVKPVAAAKPKAGRKRNGGVPETGKILAFMRTEGEPVKLDRLREKLWMKKDPAALSRALYSLKKRGRVKRLGHKTWALSATASA